MVKRWTIEELKNTSDAGFIHVLLSERLNGLTNTYSPLAEKLREVINRANPGMEIQRTLVMSTGHITLKDNAMLEGEARREDAPVLIVDQFKYGYNIYINLDENEPDEEESKEFKYSAAFKKLIKQARKLNCNYLKLDRDGEKYNGFELFEW